MTYTEHFQNGIKKIWSDRIKIALGEKIFRNKKFANKFLFFIGQTSRCPDLRALEQIPFDLQLLKVSPSSEKIVEFEKTALKIFLLRKQTPPTNTVN